MKKCKDCGQELPFTKRNGIRSYKHKYGYGINCGCYNNWLLTTEEGQEKLNKATLKAKKEAQKKRKSEERFKKMNNPEIYHSELKETLQAEINKIVRLIDKGVGCIDCQRMTSAKWDAGHFRSRGDQPKLRYHLDNIFIQDCQCNHRSEGDKIAYLNGVRLLYGEDYAKKVEGLRKEIETLKMPHSELPEKIKVAREIVRELEKLDMTYPPKMRIKLREKYNKRLGIYQ